MERSRSALALFLIAFTIALVGARPAGAAEATTGMIVGRVVGANGQPVVNAQVTATSPSARATARTDTQGRFTMFGLAADTYTVAVNAAGFEETLQGGVTVAPGQTQQLAFRLVAALQKIGSVRATTTAFALGATSDTFTVSGDKARALAPPVSSSGLANYAAGTVQGAIASVPGVDLDPFANAILRGGKIDDAAFEYDSVPIPQGLVAEPGGNIVGAQLPTTGVASTNVTLAGYQTQAQNALGGVIDQIPAVGTYPGSTTLELGNGIGGPSFHQMNFQYLGATPDLKWRYALASTLGNEQFTYGDGKTFYPSEAATYGLALSSRAQSSIEGNVHYQLTPKDDLSFLALVGQAVYNQYGSPFAGETVGQFNGQNTVFPGSTDPNAPVTYAAGVRGSYDVFKTQWVHTGEHSLSRVQLYESIYGSSAGGPFWDENGYPDGAFSLWAQQGARQYGLGYDGDNVASERHHLRFGAQVNVNNSFLNQIVPTADEFINSSPTFTSLLTYFGDTWSPSSRLDLTATGRLMMTHIRPSDGTPYDVNALDPHFSAAYKLGDRYALRATYDHTTVAPAPLEASRTDSANVDTQGNLAPFVPLAASTGNDFTYSFEARGRTQVRATYYATFEKNRVDVLPVNFRSLTTPGALAGVGVPTNVGDLQAHGVELWLKNGPLTLDSSYVRAYSSSASQFAFNNLNAAAIAAGHLFPVGYVPDFTTTLSYEFDLAKHRIRITPSLSYESGYPYGNGKMVWIFGPDGKPIQVPNDNNVNPGFSYYFLQDPTKAYNPTTNPYIGNLGTSEGNDPNTLRSPPQTLVNLHIEGDVSTRATLILDVANLLGEFAPTAYQGNPWLIGPPGYHLNGVPPAGIPWTYGTGGYVPQSYPMGRTVQLQLRYRV
jgi:Carboxypeptidase regulatory-like domain